MQCEARLKRLIRRPEHQHRYVVTSDGIKVEVFYTKLHNRLLRPLLAADLPPAPLELRRAVHVLERQDRRVRGLASMLKVSRT